MPTQYAALNKAAFGGALCQSVHDAGGEPWAAARPLGSPCWPPAYFCRMPWPREAEAPWLATAQAAQTKPLALAGEGEGQAEEAVAAETKTVTLAL